MMETSETEVRYLDKIKFVIVGSGWRSLYYVRIAKALPEQFELCAMLCRTHEKAEKMSEAYNIHTTTSIQECKNSKPDFVVVVVNKTDIAKVSMEWLDYGFTVLCETPASLDTDILKKLWSMHKAGKKLVVAEQYTRYPTYRSMLKVLDSGIIGEPDCLNISLAHEYHGSSLIRMFLHQSVDLQFTVRAKAYEFPTVETLNRYQRFTDGHIAHKKRTVAVFEFADGKAAFYDFDSEQYRSPIRKNYVKVQGCRGEMINDVFYYLDEDYRERQARLVTTDRIVDTGDLNPNLSTVREIISIELKDEDTNIKAVPVYEPAFGHCGLAEDETAIAGLMMDTADYTAGRNTAFMDMQLRRALQDSYTAVLLAQAVNTGRMAVSERQPWQYEQGV